METKDRDYQLVLNSVYGGYDKNLYIEQDFKELYKELIAKEKTNKRDKLIDEILEDEYTTI